MAPKSNLSRENPRAPLTPHAAPTAVTAGPSAGPGLPNRRALPAAQRGLRRGRGQQTREVPGEGKSRKAAGRTAPKSRGLERRHTRTQLEEKPGRLASPSLPALPGSCHRPSRTRSPPGHTPGRAAPQGSWKRQNLHLQRRAGKAVPEARLTPRPKPPRAETLHTQLSASEGTVRQAVGAPGQGAPPRAHEPRPTRPPLGRGGRPASLGFAGCPVRLPARCGYGKTAALPATGAPADAAPAAGGARRPNAGSRAPGSPRPRRPARPALRVQPRKRSAPTRMWESTGPRGQSSAR